MANKLLDSNGLLYFWGKLKAYFATISHTHTVSDVTDFPSTMTPASHTHGSITNDGKLQTSDVSVANGDKLVITDSSDSAKVKRSSVSFDGSTDTKALTQKGTWETFSKTDTTYAAGVQSDIETGTSTTQSTWTPKILHDYVAAVVAGAVSGGAAFQGTAPTTFAPTSYTAGWYWVVGTAGTYAGETCEIGDMIFAKNNYSSAYSASDFVVLQTNLDITNISNGDIDTICAS